LSRNLNDFTRHLTDLSCNFNNIAQHLHAAMCILTISCVTSLKLHHTLSILHDTLTILHHAFAELIEILTILYNTLPGQM
jgi:hypothetical protein